MHAIIHPTICPYTHPPHIHSSTPCTHPPNQSPTTTIHSHHSPTHPFNHHPFIHASTNPSIYPIHLLIHLPPFPSSSPPPPPLPPSLPTPPSPPRPRLPLPPPPIPRTPFSILLPPFPFHSTPFRSGSNHSSSQFSIHQPVRPPTA